ncbi:transient receptor potential cation channel protein painless [Chrysoperla carnea]|uniref:transient receptor potential cation channel protein painless n=1 Tax=Chrysoperla carnea TaxID=189513 RepID=UPI001D07A773|nr:transient receptor potential cation channel protein painless [Chrysoperla carnea]
MENHELNIFRTSATKRPSTIILERTNSLCTKSDNQQQLLNALRNRHIITFKKIITSSAVDVNYCYEYPDYKTCLELACCEHTPEFVDLLLRHGANPNLINTHHNRAAIHFAVERADSEIVKRLLREPKLDVNILSQGNTPLALIIKQIVDDEDNLDKYIECIQLLLKANADVNIPDAKGATPIYLAAKNGYKQIVALILEQSIINVDIDSYKDRSGKTARDLILNKNLYTKTLPKYIEKRSETNKSKLYILLSQCNEEDFIEQLKNYINTSGSDILDSNNGLYTLLQLACEKGLDKCVARLLVKGANPNISHANNLQKPIEIACLQGYHIILKKLLAHSGIIVPSTILHTVVKYMTTTSQNPKIDYGICLDLLLHDSRINVNTVDVKNNTALHYAARNSDHDSILQLLRAGACVSICNTFKEPPLADIPPATLHSYLDECLNTNDERCTDENYEITFNYDFLVPPNNSNNKYIDTQCSIPIDDENIEMSPPNNNNYTIQNNQFLAPETDALLYMTQNPELRHLLKHPVLTSFLFLKWQRISWLFYTNLAFYVTFCLLLICYILIGYGQSSEDRQDDPLARVLSVLLLIGCIVLSLRELFQLLVSPKIYFINYENWLEIPLIVVAFTIVFHEPREHIRQQLSAIAILLSALELVLLIGQHPSLSTNIVMLKTVSWNFFKFLLWYSILLIAFALSFYTLFRGSPQEESKQNSTTNGKEDDKEGEENFFLDPGMSLFKTIVMLTGEFDAASIDFKSFPITSHLIFVMFVFLIAIVLFNLLNGLAVSDTQMIKKDAELVGYVTRIELISYIENMMLGDVPPIGRLIQKICCCVNFQTNFCIKPLASKICLFPNYLPQNKISIKPNQGRKIICKNEKDVQVYTTSYESKITSCCLINWCKDIQMDTRVVKEAKRVINEKNTITEFDDLKKSLSFVYKNISECETHIKLTDKRLDEISEILLNITKILTNNQRISDES